jgi:repressor LexA
MRCNRIHQISDQITEPEARVLCVLEHSLRPGFCPGREEISRAAGMGSRGSHISNLLKSLDEKGFIGLTPGRSRSIALLRRADGRRFSFDTVWAPVAGIIGASRPRDTATEDDNAFSDEAVELTRSLVAGRDDVVTLRVAGGSMIEAAVNDGDLVVIAPSDEIRDGDMVAASVKGEGRTLKYFHRLDGKVELRPANAKMHIEPMIYHPSLVRIEGKVLLVIRQVTGRTENRAALNLMAA